MGNKSRGNGQARIIQLKDLPPEVADALAEGGERQRDVPVEIQRIWEVNAFRTELERQEAEARELLALLPPDDPKRAALETYQGRLAKARKELAPIHARALARVANKATENMDRVLEKLREANQEPKAAPAPAAG
jgi:hypothetical protein